MYDLEEVIEVINDLTDNNIIGDNDLYDHGDIDIIIDNLN